MTASSEITCTLTTECAAAFREAAYLNHTKNTAFAARYDSGDDLLRMDQTLPSVSTSYYLCDGLGSTRQLVNTAGAVTDSYGYSAFGELVSHTGSTVNLFLFNAQQFDGASGDYFLRARYYDQSNGRFISQDPFVGSDEDPISLHRYLYASDDPTDRVDPAGMSDDVDDAQGKGYIRVVLDAFIPTEADSRLPDKKSKLHPLTKEQKVSNRKLSSERFVIEHIIRSVKIFRILAEGYRNRRRRFGLRFNLIAALYNFGRPI